MKKILFLIVLVAMALGGTLVYRSRDQAAGVVLRTAAIERGDVVVSISATGTVEPEEVIDVGAQVAGQILTFGKDVEGKPVDYGSVIEEGTILANIDDALYTSEVAQAEAQVLSAQGGQRRAEADLGQLKAKLEQAERDWARARELGPSQALAATAYDGYKWACEIARANVAVGEAAIVQARGSLAQAEGTLLRAKRNLGYTTIASPVRGVIIDRRVNIGQTVVASLNAPSLFLIAKDLTRMQVWVAVNEADIGRLKPGQPVSFTVDAFPGESFKGQVGKIRLNASMTQNVVTFTVEVVADNANGRLLPYLTANVKFELKRKDGVLLVPNTALRWTPSSAEQIAPQYRKVLEGGQAATSQTEHSGSAASAPAHVRVHAGEPQVGLVWVMDGTFVRPVVVKLGLTDDVVTEVWGEEVVEGLKVVTGQEKQAAAASTVSTNPFLPKPPRFGRGGGGPPPPM